MRLGMQKKPRRMGGLVGGTAGQTSNGSSCRFFSAAMTITPIWEIGCASFGAQRMEASHLFSRFPERNLTQAVGRYLFRVLMIA
jgi:hypothetical protein